MCAEGPTFNKEMVALSEHTARTAIIRRHRARFSLMDYHEPQSLTAKPIGTRCRAHDAVWKPKRASATFWTPQISHTQEIDHHTQWARPATRKVREDLPRRLFPDGWPLGQPDLVLTAKAPFTVVRATIFTAVSVCRPICRKTSTSARWTSARQSLHRHHAVVYADPGQSLGLAGNDPAASYTCFGDAAWKRPIHFWPLGRRGITPRSWRGHRDEARRGTRLAMQLHYHPSATGGTDQTQLGIYFAKGDVDKIVRQEFLLNTSFTIPPGNSNYPVQASTLIGRGGQPARGKRAAAYAPPGRKMQVEGDLCGRAA